jgi:hypothetical protein
MALSPPVRQIPDAGGSVAATAAASVPIVGALGLERHAKVD